MEIIAKIIKGVVTLGVVAVGGILGMKNNDKAAKVAKDVLKKK